MFDVLMYLFETYIHSEMEILLDQDNLTEELAYAGFQRDDIYKALHWMERLATLQNNDTVPYMSATDSRATRVYSAEEMARLNTECRGFLLLLEHLQILTSETREMVTDRVMALEASGLTLEDLKWVVFMVLLNVPGHKTAYYQLEALLFDANDVTIH